MNQNNKPLIFSTFASIFLALMALILTIYAQSDNSGWSSYTGIVTVPIMIFYCILGAISHGLYKSEKDQTIFIPFFLVLGLVPILLFISIL